MSLEKSIQKLVKVVTGAAAPPTVQNKQDTKPAAEWEPAICSKLIESDGSIKKYPAIKDLDAVTWEAVYRGTKCKALSQNTKDCSERYKESMLSSAAVRQSCEQYAASQLSAVNNYGLTDAQKKAILDKAKCTCYTYAMYSTNVTAGGTEWPKKLTETLRNPKSYQGSYPLPLKPISPGQLSGLIWTAYNDGCSLSFLRKLIEAFNDISKLTQGCSAVIKSD